MPGGLLAILHGQNGEDVWDSYVENNVPSAWRVFWHYGPGERVITVVLIHPAPLMRDLGRSIMPTLGQRGQG
jgi:hypothetical protein